MRNPGSVPNEACLFRSLELTKTKDIDTSKFCTNCKVSAGIREQLDWRIVFWAAMRLIRGRSPLVPRGAFYLRNQVKDRFIPFRMITPRL